MLESTKVIFFCLRVLEMPILAFENTRISQLPIYVTKFNWKSLVTGLPITAS